MQGWQIDMRAGHEKRTGLSLGLDFHEWLVFLVMLTSFYVKSVQGRDQAAPFDLFMAGIMALLFALGLRFPRGMGWPLLFWGLLLIGYGVGNMGAIYLDRATPAFMASIYLVGVFLFFAAFVFQDPGRRLNIIFNAYSAAAVCAALAGIGGYFGFLPPEIFTDFGRASGTFNDPNVFGPYLIAPAIYLGLRVSKARAGMALLLMIPLGILLLGLLLSFSRGAWGAFILSSAIFMWLTLATSTSTRQTMRLIMFASGMMIFVALVLVVALSTPQIAALFAERATLVQDYDVSEHGGRFASQADAFSQALHVPWGIGQNQWAMINKLDTHNVYLHVLVAGGWLAGLSFVGLLLTTIWRGWRAAHVPGPGQGVLIVALAAIIGHCAEAFIIDIDNWRHFFVLMGSLWGGILWAEQSAKGAVNPRREQVIRTSQPPMGADVYSGSVTGFRGPGFV